MSDLYIDVKVYGGANIRQAIPQMVDLANRLGISVWASLNGVRTLARPGDDPADILTSWEHERTSTRGYPTASANKRTARNKRGRPMTDTPTGTAELVKRLRAQDEHDRLVFEHLVTMRDKQTCPQAWADINYILKAFAARDPVLLDAANAMEAEKRERVRLEKMVSQVAKAGLDAADIALATGQQEHSDAPDEGAWMGPLRRGNRKDPIR